MSAPEPTPSRDDRPHRRSRLDGLSDGVFAIVLTLLVLDLLPGHVSRSPAELLADWPAYLAFLAAFLTTASIWLSHHELLLRITEVDTRVLAINIGLLLGVSLVPWPTALIGNAIRDGGRPDEIAAFVIWGVSFTIMGTASTALGIYALRRGIVRADGDARWVRRSVGSAIGCIVVSVVGILLATIEPVAALVLFLLVPVAYLVVLIARSGRRRKA